MLHKESTGRQTKTWLDCLATKTNEKRNGKNRRKEQSADVGQKVLKLLCITEDAWERTRVVAFDSCWELIYFVSSFFWASCARSVHKRESVPCQGSRMTSCVFYNDDGDEGFHHRLRHGQFDQPSLSLCLTARKKNRPHHTVNRWKRRANLKISLRAPIAKRRSAEYDFRLREREKGRQTAEQKSDKNNLTITRRISFQWTNTHTHTHLQRYFCCWNDLLFLFYFRPITRAYTHTHILDFWPTLNFGQESVRVWERIFNEII